MKNHTLSVKTRTAAGSRKSGALRRKGIIPATIYGKGIENQNIQIERDTFIRTLKESGETGLITLILNEKEHPALIKRVHLHPVNHTVLHVEFYRVNLKEKIKTNVPIVLIGEAIAVKEKTGLLLQILSELEIEALPTDLPERIDIDVSGLAQLNQTVFVKDIPPVPNVHILTDEEQIVAKIGELTAPEPEPEPEQQEEGETAAGENEEVKEKEGEKEGEKQPETEDVKKEE